MDSSWKWGPGQVRVKGREVGTEGEQGKVFGSGFLSLSQKWGLAPFTSSPHRNLFPQKTDGKRSNVPPAAHPARSRTLCLKEALLLLCEASLSHDVQKGIDFLENSVFQITPWKSFTWVLPPYIKMEFKCQEMVWFGGSRGRFSILNKLVSWGVHLS